MHVEAIEALVEKARASASFAWWGLLRKPWPRRKRRACRENIPGCTRTRSHRHTPITVRQPERPRLRVVR